MSAANAKSSPTSPSPTRKPSPVGADRLGTSGGIFAGALLLAVLVFGAFLNGINAPFIFDDTDSIPGNPSIRSFSTALTPPTNSGITVSGRPVLNLSFAINYAFSKADSKAYHLGNILIHALAALTLWGVVRRTLQLPVFANRFSRDATWLAWLAAALWAVHPLQTESVTYLVQRAESLVGVFYLLTLYCFIRYTTAHNRFWFAASLSVCLLGMGTKEVMATAPFVIFLYDRTFISGTFRKAWQQQGRLHLGHACTLLLLGTLVFSSRARGSSVGASDVVTHWNYLCTQAYALVRYTWLSFCPSSLTLDYGTLVITDAFTIVSCGAIVATALGITIWAIVRKPILGFLGAWFFALLAPSSSFIPVNTQTIAEHRVYLALAAIILATALTSHKLLGRHAWVLLVLLIVPATAATVARNHVYLSEVGIWQDSLTKQPTNYRAWASIGFFRLHIDNQPAEAKRYLERAVELKPNYMHALNRLGHALIKLGQTKEGIDLVEKSLVTDPNSMALNAGAGSAYIDAGLYERAVSHLQKALEPDPASSAINRNLAISLTKLGRDTEAEPHFRTALENEPDSIDALNDLGALLRRTGRIDEAIAVLSRALALSPGSALAHGNLGIAYITQGKTNEGLSHLQEAVRLEPKSYELRTNLCQALARTAHYNEAISMCEALLQEKPDVELYNNLGGLYGQTGQLAKAATAFHAALEIDPTNTKARNNYERAQAYLEAQRKH